MEVGERETNLPVFSVVDFLAVINQILDYSFPLVQVVGEVASFKINHDKYIFFDLKDETASLSCFMIKFKLSCSITDGMKVIVTARPNVTKFSKFSLIVEQLQPFGEGELKKQRDLLYKKLAQKGLFDQERKRILPTIPQTIGVISSTDSASYKDFIKILNERWSGLHIVVKNTSVQGVTAVDELCQALDEFNQLDASEAPDLIAIVRGGGSKDDLSCFDDEKLVLAIANSRLPIATGIGHEIDTSLADLAADLAAATPSHLAQLLVPNKINVLDSLEQQLNRVKCQLNQQLNQQMFDADNKQEYFRQMLYRRLKELQQKLDQTDKLLEALSPRRILEKGYAIIHEPIVVGRETKLETKDRIIKVKVKEIYDKND